MQRISIPRPLGLLLLCCLVLGLGWTLIVPPLGGPDETTHFGYLEGIAEQHERPSFRPGTPFSSAQRVLMVGSNADVLSHVSSGRPQWSEQQAEVFERLGERSKTDNGGGGQPAYFNTAQSNPPLFYLVETPAYKLGALFGGESTRLYVVRLFVLPWLLILVTATWLLIGELFGRQRLLQLAGAASVGLLPMVVHFTSVVSVDSALYALWTLVLWLGVRGLKRGLDRPTAIGLGVATLAAVATKYTSLSLIPPVLGVYLVAWAPLARRVRRARDTLSTTPRRIGAGLGLTAVIGAIGVLLATRGPAQFRVVVVEGGFNVPQFLSYLWQFYLPRLGFLTDIPTLRGIPVYDVWFYDGVGNFGALQIHQPAWIYPVLGIVAVVVLILGVPRLVRSQPWVVTAFLALTAALLIAGLHVNEFRTGVLPGITVMQGRYLFPIIGIFAAIVVAAISRVPARHRPIPVALVLGTLIALQIVSFSRAAGFWYV